MDGSSDERAPTPPAGQSTEEALAREVPRLTPRRQADWERAVELDEHLLRDLVDHLRDGRKPANLGIKLLSKASGGAEPVVKKMFRALDPRPLPIAMRLALLRYVLAEFPRMVLSEPDTEDTADPAILCDVVVGMNRFLRVGDETRKHLPARLDGLYWVYRRSVVDPGKYIRGLLAMWWIQDPLAAEPGTGMVRVCEVHRAQPEIKGSQYEAPGLSETYDGFALIKKNTLFLFLAERYSGHDRGPLLISRFHHFVPSEQSLPMQIARGWLPGAGESGLALPIVLVRTRSTLKPSQLLEFLKLKERSHADGNDALRLATALRPVEALYDACDIVDADGVPSMVIAQLASMARDNEVQR